MDKEYIEIETPVSVELYKDENAMKEANGAVIGDFVTTALANDAARKINNHDRLVEEVAALREALRLKEAECEGLVVDKGIMKEALVECMDALEMSYDVNDWPANGKTIQDFAAVKAGAILEEMSDEK